MQLPPSRFTRCLLDWQAAANLSQRQLANLLGVHESTLSQTRRTDDGGRRPSQALMARAIYHAPEPWRSALRQAREADQHAADELVIRHSH